MKISSELIEKHRQKSLDERLVDIELSNNAMHKHAWTGQLRSKHNGRLVIALETEGIFHNLCLREEAGELVRDEDFFMLRCRTESGLRIELKHIYPCHSQQHPLKGIKVVFEPDEVAFDSDTPCVSAPTFLVGEINSFRDTGACCFGSLLNSDSPLGVAGSKQSWFQFNRAEATFALGSHAEGFRPLAVWASGGDTIDTVSMSKGFLHALSYYVGERVGWLGFDCCNEGKRRTVLKQPVPTRRSLQQNPRPKMFSQEDEKALLSCAFDFFVRPENLRVVNWVAMVWDSTDNFFPIQCLVAATVVEGLANHIVGEEWNKETMCKVKQLKRSARKLVTKNWTKLSQDYEPTVAKIYGEKIPDSISQTRPFSARELVQEAARIKDVSVTAEEVRAWRKLRDPLAHGNYGSDRPQLDDVQATSRQFDCTLNLINKLVLGLIGYRGPHVDFSQVGWPIWKENKS